MLEIVQLKEGPHSHAGVAFSDRCRNNGVSEKEDSWSSQMKTAMSEY